MGSIVLANIYLSVRTFIPSHENIFGCADIYIRAVDIYIRDTGIYIRDADTYIKAVVTLLECANIYINSPNIYQHFRIRAGCKHHITQRDYLPSSHRVPHWQPHRELHIASVKYLSTEYWTFSCTCRVVHYNINTYSSWVCNWAVNTAHLQFKVILAREASGEDASLQEVKYMKNYLHLRLEKGQTADISLEGCTGKYLCQPKCRYICYGRNIHIVGWPLTAQIFLHTLQ